MMVDANARYLIFSFVDGFGGLLRLRYIHAMQSKPLSWLIRKIFIILSRQSNLLTRSDYYSHDKLYDCLKEYIDDLVVNSKVVHNHVNDLSEVFKRFICYKLIMNLLYCVFGISFGKFIGFNAHRKGNDLNPAKAKAISAM